MKSLFMKTTSFITAMIAALISGCSSISGDKYLNSPETLNFESYFNGKIDVWGIIQDRNQNVIRKFTATIDASWNDGIGTLDERFIFDDGEKQKRVWSISKISENQYEGRASDVLGNAKGHLYGNALQWKYDMMIPYNGKEYKVTLDDWMWAFDDNVIINRSYMKKFGFTVAEITIFMKKEEQ